MHQKLMLFQSRKNIYLTIRIPIEKQQDCECPPGKEFSEFQPINITALIVWLSSLELQFLFDTA